jgi:hypothetical protein
MQADGIRRLGFPDKDDIPAIKDTQVRCLPGQSTQTLQVRLGDVQDLYVVEDLRAQLEQAECEAVVFCCWILRHHGLSLEGAKDPQSGASAACQASGDFIEAEPVS